MFVTLQDSFWTAVLVASNNMQEAESQRKAGTENQFTSDPVPMTRTGWMRWRPEVHRKETQKAGHMGDWVS